MVTIQVSGKFTIRKEDEELYKEFIELAKHDLRFKVKKNPNDSKCKEYKKFELSKVITTLWKNYLNARKKEILKKGEENANRGL